MASLLLARPHLAPRPVRAASLARRGHRAGATSTGATCVELARKATGRTSPNPMVGCVIVRDGRVVGEGYMSLFLSCSDSF
jgi:diaminohydroxyphosphoribosylaminopyrimidine deaminase / 5-amino-6-(5-phosphoribosylamino)uracil reductase